MWKQKVEVKIKKQKTDSKTSTEMDKGQMDNELISRFPFSQQKKILDMKISSSPW